MDTQAKRILFLPSTEFLDARRNRILLALTGLFAFLYFGLLLLRFTPGNPVLFWLLVAGEIFHLWLVFTYLYTVWDMEYSARFDQTHRPAVDVFITAAGEPVEIVEQTARAALAMQYPDFHVYLLNDGYVAKKPNWKDIEELAQRLGITCITRTVAGGAKAGNFNNGLRQTSSPLVAIFDADQVPHPDFLEKTVGYFADSAVGFVQSPQYYKNYELNEITQGAWEQQELFFGPICKGKNRLNSTFMCGTNMVMRRSAMLGVGGMCEFNIAEDFLTSLFIHEQGWKSVYVPDVLAEGLAPEDFQSYYKQQFRWARGSLEVMFRFNPLFRKGLSFRQKVQYLASASYYFSGAIVLMNALLPIIFFFTGLVPVQNSTMAVAAIFMPYIFLNVIILRLSSNDAYTFRALAFSMGSFTIHLQALWAVLTNQKSGFSVTAKKRQSGNYIKLVIPHLLYFGLILSGVFVAIVREGASAAVITNLSWAMFNAAAFVPFIFAALPSESELSEAQITYQSKPALSAAGNPIGRAPGFSTSRPALYNRNLRISRPITRRIE